MLELYGPYAVMLGGLLLAALSAWFAIKEGMKHEQKAF